MVAYVQGEDVERQMSVGNSTDVDCDEEISITVWNEEVMAVMPADYDVSRVQQEALQKMACWRPLPSFRVTENAVPFDLENFISTLIRTAPTDIGKMRMCGYVIRCNSVEELITFAKSVFFQLLLPCILPSFSQMLTSPVKSQGGRTPSPSSVASGDDIPVDVGPALRSGAARVKVYSFDECSNFSQVFRTRELQMSGYWDG